MKFFVHPDRLSIPSTRAYPPGTRRNALPCVPRCVVLLFALALALVKPFPAQAGTTPPPHMGTAARSASLVRVNSTNQAYDFLRPWSKKPPFTRRGIGVVVAPNRVLVTAELVANHNFIEFERPESGERAVAAIEFVDYDANLALLRAEDPAFLQAAPPVTLAETARVGEEVAILQLEPTGTAAETTARLTTITTGSYLADDVSLLVFRLSAPIQQREGSFVLPAFRGRELLGLLMRYDSRNQTADVIPSPVIRRFLEQAQTGEFTSFPRAGITFAGLRDPSFRNFLGLENNGGVFLGRIQPGSSAEKAELREGDVLLRIGQSQIDADGNIEHPDFGRLPMNYLISTEARVGDVIPFLVYRDGKQFEIPVRLERQDRESMRVPPYLFDKQPRYLILGGMVFRELNRAYLQEWGPDWRGTAPQRLVAADLFQNEEAEPAQRVVFLSQVIPTPATLGYESFADTIIESVNGHPVASLEELAEKLSDTSSGIHRIELADDPGWIFLDPSTFEQTAMDLEREYGISHTKNFE
jgi:hypothetical protein